MNEAAENTDKAGRPPQTLAEHVTANCRPQPAIPAVLAMLVLAAVPMMSLLPSGAEPAVWQLWLIGAGFLASAGLAIAAGFCSLAPQAIWLLLAAWLRSLAIRAELPDALVYLLYVCAAAVTAMIAVQLWRIISGRFVPTVRETSE